MSEFSEEKVTEAMEETAQSVEAQLEEATTEAVEAQSEETQPETVEEASEESAEVSAAPEGDAEVEAEDEPGESSDTASSEDAAEVQMSEYDVTMPTPGAIIKGKVVHVSSDEVLVDIDYKSEGRIPLNELSFISNANPEDLVSVGDEIHVKVLKVDDAEGNVVLSKRRADADLSWERLENLYNSGETLEAKVVQVVKGGLLVNVGVRGFIPASHVSRGFEDNLEKYVGQTLELKDHRIGPL